MAIGANPAAADAVISKFDAFDALTPMPLLGLQIACGFAMPFVNAFSLLADTLLPAG